MRRALSEHQKQQRRDTLVSAARTLFDASDYEAVSMAAVARSASVAKGTVYVYFPSKEALFLEVCVREVSAFFQSFEEALPPLPEAPPKWRLKTAGVDSVLRAIEEAFAAHPTFLRLVTLMHVVLEQQTDPPTATAFRAQLLGLFREPAAALERHLLFVEPGEGVHLILRVHAMTVGFAQVAAAAESFDGLLRAAGRPALDMPFPHSLLQALRHLLLGMQADRGPARRGATSAGKAPGEVS